MVDTKLRERLVCPQCHGPLTLETRPERLVCPACHLAYPVRDGVPVMLVAEATPRAH